MLFYVSRSNKTVDGLEEFQTEHTRIAIPGVPDAGTSPPLAIIGKVNLWIHNIREKKSSKGDDRRERQHLEKKFKAIATHWNSDEYIIKQVVVLFFAFRLKAGSINLNKHSPVITRAPLPR